MIMGNTTVIIVVGKNHLWILKLVNGRIFEWFQELLNTNRKIALQWKNLVNITLNNQS